MFHKKHEEKIHEKNSKRVRPKNLEFLYITRIQDQNNEPKTSKQHKKLNQGRLVNKIVK